MQLVERHIIKKGNYYYKELDETSYKSKNLYNSALYYVRQQFFNTGKYINYESLYRKFYDEQQPDYFSLPANVAQQTMKMVHKNFKSFFEANKKYKKDSSKFTSKPKIPKYLDKQKGRYLLTYTQRVISKKHLDKEHKLSLTGLHVLINTELSYNCIQQVRIVHKLNYYVIEIIYNVNEIQLKGDNNKYASIDLGINNLATVSSNVTKPFIVNGRPLKSINHYYNKKKAKLQSQQKKNNKQINRNKLRILELKRKNLINNYLHKASRLLMNHLVSKEINTLIIGLNKKWKQDINIGKVNNQNFVQIPFNTFISMLQYKCKFEGINVILQEESYTSKASFLDRDFIPTYSKNNIKYEFSGYRCNRGLYKSNIFGYINADLNGSLNIMRKALHKNVIPNTNIVNGIQVCGVPSVINITEHNLLYF